MTSRFSAKTTRELEAIFKFDSANREFDIRKYHDVNKLGLRGTITFDKNKKSIVILGGDETFGVGMEYSDVWVQDVINNKPDHNIVNLAVPVSSLACQLRYLMLCQPYLDISTVICVAPYYRHNEVYSHKRECLINVQPDVDKTFMKYYYDITNNKVSAYEFFKVLDHMYKFLLKHNIKFLITSTDSDTGDLIQSTSQVLDKMIIRDFSDSFGKEVLDDLV